MPLSFLSNRTPLPLSLLWRVMERVSIRSKEISYFLHCAFATKLVLRLILCLILSLIFRSRSPINSFCSSTPVKAFPRDKSRHRFSPRASDEARKGMCDLHASRQEKEAVVKPCHLSVKHSANFQSASKPTHSVSKPR